MQEIIIEIPEEICEELERNSFEVRTRQDIIDRFFEKHAADQDISCFNSPAFNYFLTLLTEAESSFEILKQKVQQTYIPAFLQKHSINWTLDYFTNQITINILCDCEILELSE